MGIIRKYQPGDPVFVTWEMLKNIPAVVRKVRTGGDWISVAIDPKDLVNADVERGGFFRISPDGYVHLEVRQEAGEIEPRGFIINE